MLALNHEKFLRGFWRHPPPAELIDDVRVRGASAEPEPAAVAAERMHLGPSRYKLGNIRFMDACAQRETGTGSPPDPRGERRESE